jgi:hypothetical protein
MTRRLYESHKMWNSSQPGARGGAVGLGSALQTWMPRVWFPIVSLEFFIDIILPAHYDPGVDSASNRNEYQEYLLEGKGSQRVGPTTLPPFEIWERQSPGNLRAWRGNALSFNSSHICAEWEKGIYRISHGINLNSHYEILKVKCVFHFTD